jgi:hypothetical protein
LKEVEARTPSVVVEFVSDGAAVRDVHLLVDGVAREGGADGRAMELDPGTHTFRAEPAGAPPVSVDVLLREGEKLKVVRIELGNKAAPIAKEPTKDAPAPTSTTPTEARRPVPWGVYVAGGLGLAAAGAFTVFGISGKAGKSDLEPCKPDCSESRISNVRQKFIIADVFLGVSVVSLAVAGYLFFTRPAVSASVGGQGSRSGSLRVLSDGAFAF